MTGSISEVSLKPKDVRPIIVRFPNQISKVKKLQTAILKKKHRLIAAVASGEILYVGNVTRDNDDSNNFLLVRNRATSKVRLIAVDSASLSPRLNLESKSVVDGTVNTSNLKSISELNKQFGSKRIKRITEQKERLEMDIEHVKEQLEETVAGIEVNEADLYTSHGENDNAHRPPIDRNAKTKEQVYNLSKIIPKEVLRSLEDEAYKILESDLASSDITTFVQRCIEQLDDQDVEKVELFLYINYLIKFITRPAKNINRKTVICETSKEVNDHILNNFTVLTNTGRTRPVSMRDKSLCYIMVLAMIGMNYKLDLELLSKDVKLGLKKLQDVGRILAFSTDGKNKNVMILKLPLPAAVKITVKARKK